MKKLLTLILLFIPLAIFSQKSTFNEKLSFQIGFSSESVNFREPTGRSILQTSYQIFGLDLGVYYAIAQSNDAMSIGFYPSVRLGLYSIGSVAARSFQAPIFLVGRLGANSTKFNMQNLGVGLGVGMVYTNFKVTDFNPTFWPLDHTTSFKNPAFLTELSTNLGGRPIFIRFLFPLKKHSIDAPYIESSLQKDPVKQDYKSLSFSVNAFF